MLDKVGVILKRKRRSNIFIYLDVIYKIKRERKRERYFC